MKRIRNIIFDFDGTLADTSRLIVATMQQTITDYGLPYRNDEQIKATIGVRLEGIPSILWPSFKGPGEPFANLYRKNFEELKHKISVELYPGVKDTLSQLKESGHRMAVATSRSHRSVKELNGQLGIIDYFDFLLGGDDVKEGKPNPESIYRILDKMNWEADETMMVGDMPVDILMGKNAGIKTCGVTYGNGKVLELEESGADFLISTFSNLTDILD